MNMGHPPPLGAVVRQQPLLKSFKESPLTSGVVGALMGNGFQLPGSFATARKAPEEIKAAGEVDPLEVRDPQLARIGSMLKGLNRGDNYCLGESQSEYVQSRGSAAAEAVPKRHLDGLRAAIAEEKEDRVRAVTAARELMQAEYDRACGSSASSAAGSASSAASTNFAAEAGRLTDIAFKNVGTYANGKKNASLNIDLGSGKAMEPVSERTMVSHTYAGAADLGAMNAGKK